MNEFSWMLLAFLVYFLVTFLNFMIYFFQKKNLKKAAYFLALSGLIFHSVSLLLRTFHSGHAPFTNMYESVSFLAWASVLVLIIFERKFGLEKAGPLLWLMVIALMALASSPSLPKDITPLVPALQSYWLWLHVSVTILGEAFLAVAFVASLLYLLAGRDDSEESKIKMEKYDRLAYRAVAVGFPLFTLGAMIFGMIWASRAWGRYWGWDPKEVWSLITWLFYALYLHTRLVMGWKGKKSAIVAIIGFLSALFTFFGVNYLLKGLHSYV